MEEEETNCISLIGETDNFHEQSVTLLVDDATFTMNKSLLASSSEYFRLMFLGSFVERHLDVVRIEIVRKEDFQLFIDFLLQRELCWEVVNSSNLMRILDSATMLRLNGFVHECGIRLMESWEKFGNASEIYSISKSYQMVDLTRHMVRLLAQCMDIGFQISLSEMFYDTIPGQCVYLNEVSYQYLLHCLQNSESDDILRLGPTPKEYFTSTRESLESKSLLEWVLRWIFNSGVDQDYRLDIKQIESLLVLCDIEFLLEHEIEETLRLAIKASEVDDLSCWLVDAIEIVLKRLGERTKSELDNLNIEIFFINSNKKNVIPAINCRKSKVNGQWRVDELAIAIDAYALRVIGHYNGWVYFYWNDRRDFWRYRLKTREMIRFTDWQMDVYFLSAVVSGDHLFCYCAQNWIW